MLRYLIASVALMAVAYCVSPEQARQWDEELHAEGSSGANNWVLVQDDPRIVISRFKRLPKEIKIRSSNNCLSISEFDGKLFIAWRTAPFHFASVKTKMYVMSSIDDGESWEYEHEIELEADVREPYLVETAGHFYLYFFQAGTDPIAFQPNH